MNETIKLTTYRNSDLRVIYQFPKGYNLAGFLPAFFIRATPGAFPLLAINATPTPNGSSAIIVGSSVVLTLNYMDLSTLPSMDVWDGVYDSSLTKDGFVNRFAGGPITQYIDGSYGDDEYSDNVFVEIGGQTVPVIITGGNLNAQALAGFLDLEQAVVDAEQAAVTATQQAGIAAGAAATAIASLANKADATVTQLGTGALPRTQQAISRDFFWAESYGAVGDGVTNDAPAIQRGIDYLASIGGGDLRFKAKTYAIAAMLDMGGKHNVKLVGSGNTNFGLAATTIKWIGAGGGVMLGANYAPAQTSGCGISGMAWNGNGLALTAWDTRAIVGWKFEDLRIYDCRSYGWYLDVGAAGNSQGLRAQSVDIDCLHPSYRGCTGVYIGPGGLNNDSCQSTFIDFQIQFLDGIGLRGGSADTITFIDWKIYRYPGGTGKALVAKAGTNATGFQEWFQSNTFIGFEPRALDGDKTDFVLVETGVITTREPENNRFGMLDQSGPEYPSFKGGTVFKNVISSETGYLLYRGVQRHDRDGRVTYGGNYDENAIVTFAGDDTKSLERLYGTNGISGQRRYDRSIDTSSQLVTTLRNDAGAVVRIIGYDMPTGGFVRQYSGSDSFKHLSLGHINLTPIANVPGNAANGSLFFLDGTGAKAAGLWIVRNGATYRLTDVAG